MEELRAEIRELQDQNRLLLTINEGLTQTHADISFLLTERRNIIAESALNSKVRDLLDKTNGARVSLSNLCTGDSPSCYIPILHLMTKVCICLEQTRLVSISQINIPTLNAVIFSLLVVSRCSYSGTLRPKLLFLVPVCSHQFCGKSVDSGRMRIHNLHNIACWNAGAQTNWASSYSYFLSWKP